MDLVECLRVALEQYRRLPANREHGRVARDFCESIDTEARPWGHHLFWRTVPRHHDSCLRVGVPGPRRVKNPVVENIDDHTRNATQDRLCPGLVKGGEQDHIVPGADVDCPISGGPRESHRLPVDGNALVLPRWVRQPDRDVQSDVLRDCVQGSPEGQRRCPDRIKADTGILRRRRRLQAQLPELRALCRHRVELRGRCRQPRIGIGPKQVVAPAHIAARLRGHQTFVPRVVLDEVQEAAARAPDVVQAEDRGEHARPWVQVVAGDRSVWRNERGVQHFAGPPAEISDPDGCHVSPQSCEITVNFVVSLSQYRSARSPAARVNVPAGRFM